MKNKNLLTTEKLRLLKFVNFNEISLNRLYNKKKINKKEYEYIMTKKKELEDNNNESQDIINDENENNLTENEINNVLNSIDSKEDNNDNNKLSKKKNIKTSKNKSINKQNELINKFKPILIPKKPITKEDLRNNCMTLINAGYEMQKYVISEYVNGNLTKDDFTEEFNEFIRTVTTIHTMV